MTQTMVSLKNINKSYKSGKSVLHILKNVSMEFHSTQSIVISGSSGAGKSTLLHLLGGLDRADSGQVIVNNIDIGSLDSHQLALYRQKTVGFIFQFHYLLNDITALDNIMLPALICGTKRSVAKKIAKQLLHSVGLEERGNHYPQQLSGGEQQRTAIARALINSPQIILADEPTGNLDEENSRAIEAMLFVLIKKFNKTLIAVTHDPIMANRADVHYSLVGGTFHSVTHNTTSNS